MEQSAMPMNNKNASLSQDLIRRMVNTSEMGSQRERNQIVEKYISRLRLSGYNGEQCKNIVESGLKGYQSKLENCKKFKSKLHRPASSTIEKRYLKKLTEKTSWFKNKEKQEDEIGEDEVERNVRAGASRPPGAKFKPKPKKKSGKGQDKQPTAVMFVPRTPGGELVNKLREAEEQLCSVTGGRKIKLVEKSGNMIKRSLNTTNKTKVEHCCRENCLPCTQAEEGGGGQCKKRNITYQTNCLDCMAKGKKVTYYGESARSAYERGLEHMSDFKKQEEDSHMWKHQLEEHPNQEKVKFRMKVVKTHRTALQRQVHEAVLISLNASDKILNSMGVYNRCKLPRLTVMFGSNESNDEDMTRQNTAVEEKELETELEEMRHNKRREHAREYEPRKKRRKKTEKNVVKNGGILQTETPIKRKKSEIEENDTKESKAKRKCYRRELPRFSDLSCPSISQQQNQLEDSVNGEVPKSNILRDFCNIKKQNLTNEVTPKYTPPLNCKENVKISEFFNPIVDATRPGVKTENKAHHSSSLQNHHPPNHPPKKGLKPKKMRVNSTRLKMNVKPINEHFSRVISSLESETTQEAIQNSTQS